MHILATQTAPINDGSEAVDLEQSKGDVVIISAADSEISALAQACDVVGNDLLTLRLANLMQLSHPLSVDLYIKKTLQFSGLIVLRLLGGASYWTYGIEQLQSLVSDTQIKLVVLPGDGKPDPELQRRSTVPFEHAERLRSYFVEGGRENYRNALLYCAHLVHGTP
ncbi:MAG: cobaltochelatase subunit CobN, partial [Methyloligellaceae bacterium]